MATIPVFEKEEDNSNIPDDDSDGTDFSGGGQPNDNDNKSNKGLVDLAKKEDKCVWWLRVVTATILIIVAATVCIGVYLEGRQSEKDDFEQDFIDLGEKLVSSFADGVQQRFGIIQSFANEITVHGMQMNGSWPFVTPPQWISRSSEVARLSQLALMMLVHKVEKQQVPKWDNYTRANSGWVVEGISAKTGIPVNEVEFPMAFPTIMDGDNPGGPAPAVTTGDGPYFPGWCYFPSLTQMAIYNGDMHDDDSHRGPIDNTIATGKPTFEASEDYIDPEGRDPRYGLIKDLDINYQDDAIAVAMFPVFDGFGQDKKVVSILLTIVYWRVYFDGLLPPGVNGIIVILENTCNQQFTYRVDGTDAMFVDHGDLHDTKYNYLQTGASIDSIVDGVETTDAGCEYSIRVYPSQDFEDKYRTDKPWIYASILAALFVFTLSVLVLYDFMVERRQKIVKASAVQSGTLVSTLFPAAVREKLYEEQKEQAKTQENRSNWKSGKDGLTDDAETSANERKAAIAHLYDETTIFFADLAGFTAWSSSRTPSQVFELLEAIYGEFDKIASKRGVFKVETIGDCYVAITGIPDPQPEHAPIMVRFSRDCMRKMGQIITELAESLGEDTTNLKMRVGLHSGPVTAGVLRGHKARFQLFGDSVNTAARMESNGQPGRIHCSQATADALEARGKASWFTPREEKIVAKGKGEMQTYWVDVRSSGPATGTQMSTMSRTASDFADNMIDG